MSQGHIFFYNVLYDGLPNQIAHGQKRISNVEYKIFICHDWNQWINQCNQSVMKETLKIQLSKKTHKLPNCINHSIGNLT